MKKAEIEKPIEGSIGCLAQPVVWRWDNHTEGVVA